MSKRLKIEKKYYPPNVDQICYFIFFSSRYKKGEPSSDAFGKAFEFRSLKPLLPNGSKENHQFSGLTKTHPQGSLANPIFRDGLEHWSHSQFRTKACASWIQILLEHSSEMLFEVWGAHMSSRTGEEMLFQNRLHQCLRTFRETHKNDKKTSQREILA